jgi:hypothetical protein
MHARGRRDSHRQKKLVLTLVSSVSQMNPVPPAAGNASRWAQGIFRVLLSFEFSSVTELRDRMFTKESFQSMPHTPRLVCNKVCFWLAARRVLVVRLVIRSSAIAALQVVFALFVEVL